jgi:hypothetical protein
MSNLSNDLLKRIIESDDHSCVEAAMARELLALREAQPANHPVNDDMALAFCHAISDSSVGSDELEEVKTGLRAALANYAAPQLPAVHKGWVMVPIEPTFRMCAAFNETDFGRKSLRERYQQMIAAAPKPE